MKRTPKGPVPTPGRNVGLDRRVAWAAHVLSLRTAVPWPRRQARSAGLFRRAWERGGGTRIRMSGPRNERVAMRLRHSAPRKEEPFRAPTMPATLGIDS